MKNSFSTERGYKISFIETPVQQSISRSHVLKSIRVLKNYQIAISRLIDAGVISECESCEGPFASSYFWYPSKMGLIDSQFKAFK